MQRRNPTGGRPKRSSLRFLTRPAAGVFTAALLLSPLTASAASIFRFENRRENANSWRLVPELGLLNTTENYDDKGAKALVPGLTSYKKNAVDFTVVYGVNPKLSVFGRLSMASVAYDTTALTGSGAGLTEQGLGLNYRLWEGTSRGERTSSIDGQFALDIPLYDNISARTSMPRQPLRGEGSLDLTPALFGTFPLNQGAGQRLYALAGLGITLRGSNFSKAIPYSLQLVGLPERSGLLYRVGFHGFKSMGSDPTTGTAVSPQAQSVPGVMDSEDAGGSFIVNALNPSYLQARATLGYQWGIGDQIYATYLLPMSGTSTAVIKGFVIGAQFRFAGAKTATPTSSPAAGTARAAARPAGKLSYDLEGRVVQANDRLNLIKIDKGENDGMAKGQIVDIYRVGSDGRAADLVARGVVTTVGARETIVNLRQYKKEVWVQPGFIARRIASQKP